LHLSAIKKELNELGADGLPHLESYPHVKNELMINSIE